jgi:hypothetical protein
MIRQGTSASEEKRISLPGILNIYSCYSNFNAFALVSQKE